MSWDPFETEDSVEPRSAPARSAYESHASLPNYDHVRTGLGIIYLAMIGLFLWLMGYLIYMISFVGIANLRSVSPYAMFYFQLCSGIVGLLMFIGYCFCCGAPKEKEREKIHVVVALRFFAFLWQCWERQWLLTFSPQLLMPRGLESR